jgi:hypothetical protein
VVDDTYTYLGNFSAVEPVHTRYMVCYDCKVSWHGCWDNFMCPKCGKGELPKFGLGFGEKLLYQSTPGRGDSVVGELFEQHKVVGSWDE